MVSIGWPAKIHNFRSKFLPFSPQSVLRQLTRIQENTLVHRDFEATVKGVSTIQPDFLANGLQLKNIDGKGWGWEAERTFEPGDLVLRETAFAYIDESEVQGQEHQQQMIELAKRTLRRTVTEPGSLAYVSQLDPRRSWSLPKSEVWTGTDQMTESTAPLGLHEVFDKIESNTCTTQNADIRPSTPEVCGHGVYLRFSFFNHSCTPNVHPIVLGNVLYLRAIEAISPGDELCFSYLGPMDLQQPHFFRRKKLTDLWDFSCPCQSLDSSDILDVRPSGDWCKRHAQVLSQFASNNLYITNLLEQLIQEHQKAAGEDRKNYASNGLLFSIAHLCQVHELTKETLRAFGRSLPLAKLSLPRFHPFLITAHIGALMRRDVVTKREYHAHLEAAQEVHQVCYGGGLELFVKRWGHLYVHESDKLWKTLYGDELPEGRSSQKNLDDLQLLRESEVT